MKALSDLLARVKWKSVIVLLVLIGVVVFGLWASFNVKLFSSSYKGDGDVRERSWVDPAQVALRGKSTAWVEVKNNGDIGQKVNVKLQIYSKNMLFDETGGQEINKSVDLGPGESRKIGFKTSLNATDGGKYGMKVVVSPPGENIDDEIFLDVTER